MEDRVFCQIEDRDNPTSIFIEDELVIGIMDIDPVTTSHGLIIPKVHTPNLADIDEHTGRHLWTITQRTAAIWGSGVKCEGINILRADRKAAFQEIFNVHMHVFPRYRDDPFKIEADRDVKPSRDALDRVAGQVRLVYDRLWLHNRVASI